MSHDKADIVQYLLPIDGFAQVLYAQNLVTDFTVRSEINVRIFSAGGFDFIQLNFFQRTLTGGSLLGLGSVCGEAGDEFLQLLNLFFLLLVCFLHLLNQQLTGFIPEVIVSCIQLNLAVVNISGMGTDLI